MEDMFAPLKKYAQFSGRARRKEYWLFQLVVCAVLGSIGLAGGVLLAATPPEAEAVALIPIVVVALAMFLPTYAVGVRRLHDTGRSGWWMLVGLVPFIGGVWQLILMVLPGDEGANMYGPDPRRTDEPVLPVARVV